MITSIHTPYPLPCIDSECQNDHFLFIQKDPKKKIYTPAKFTEKTKHDYARLLLTELFDQRIKSHSSIPRFRFHFQTHYLFIGEANKRGFHKITLLFTSRQNRIDQAVAVTSKVLVPTKLFYTSKEIALCLENAGLFCRKQPLLLRNIAEYCDPLTRLYDDICEWDAVTPLPKPNVPQDATIEEIVENAFSLPK